MITIHQGSILDAKVDYIVNPANSFLQHGGGLARVIADAATAFDPQIQRFWPMSIARWRNDHELAPLIATGNAHLTSAGVLPFDGVIHAVGPIWNGGDYCERDLLELAHDRAFELAQTKRAKSIALPAISSGIFGFPIKEVARIAIAVALWYAADLDIQFWLFSDEHREAFAHQLDRRNALTALVRPPVAGEILPEQIA